jgi:toxin FitB
VAYLIDTNIISEIQKGNKADPGVKKWYTTVEEDQIYLSVLVMAELQQGIELLRRRDVKQAKILDKRMRTFRETMEDRILPINLNIAMRWAKNNVPDRFPVIDGLLAATAIEYDLILVTRNVKDVERSGARLLNPFKH